MFPIFFQILIGLVKQRCDVHGHTTQEYFFPYYNMKCLSLQNNAFEKQIPMKFS
jgi:hypothetical protein